MHGDLRADNVLLTPEKVYLVDWPYASRGAAWLDLAMLLPSVVMQGVRDVCEPVTVSADPARRARGRLGGRDVRRAPARPGRAPHGPACRRRGIAGYFLHSARQPAIPTIPSLRPFQRAQGVAALAWLEHLGL